MEILRNILCASSVVIFAISCYMFTGGLYKEKSARIVLALFSPFVFLILGSLSAAFLGFTVIPFQILLQAFIESSEDLENLRMGISFLFASLLLSYCLWWYSKKEKLNEIRFLTSCYK